MCACVVKMVHTLSYSFLKLGRYSLNFSCYKHVHKYKLVVVFTSCTVCSSLDRLPRPTIGLQQPLPSSPTETGSSSLRYTHSRTVQEKTQEATLTVAESFTLPNNYLLLMSVLISVCAPLLHVACGAHYSVIVLHSWSITGATAATTSDHTSS